MAQDMLSRWYESNVKDGVQPKDVWLDWLICDVLREEAEKLLNESSTPRGNQKSASKKTP